MAKKAVKKTTAKRKKSSAKIKKPVIHEIKSEDNSQRILTENFVAFQSVLADLSSKLNSLTEKISKMLDLFEDSAKALAEKNGNIILGQDKEVSEKLNKLLDQNKVLAQGIALLHETNAQQEAGEEQAPQPEQEPQMPPQPQMPQQQMPPQSSQAIAPNQVSPEVKSAPTARYQRSISSKY